VVPGLSLFTADLAHALVIDKTPLLNDMVGAVNPTPSVK